MNYLIFATLVLLITLLGVYMVIENNRRKAKNAEKKQFNDRHGEVTLNFKAKTSEFVAAGALPAKFTGKINAIVNNFFVVQAHSEENLNQLEKIAEQFILTVGGELNKCRELDTIKLLSDQMAAFATELPSAGVAYNRDFYREILPAMITLIKTPDQSELEQQEKTDEAEPDPADISGNEISGNSTPKPEQQFSPV